MKEIATQLVHTRIETLSKERNMYLIPKYQRGSVWSLPKKKTLVDTILRGHQIPALMVYRDGENYILNDGQQRFRTMLEFMDGDFHTLNEAELRKADPIKLDVLEPHRRFNEMTVDSQRNFRFYKVPIIEIDASHVSRQEMTVMFRRLNTGGVEMSTGELFATFIDSKAYAVIESLVHHIFFAGTYQGEKDRAQDFHMIAYCLAMEMFSTPLNLRRENLIELMAGSHDSWITDEVVQRIDENLNGLANAFTGIHMRAITDIIPLYQTVLKLKNRGYDLSSSKPGCLIAWFEQAKVEPINKLWADRKTFAQMVYPSMQQAFWLIQEKKLFRQPGIVKIEPYNSDFKNVPMTHKLIVPEGSAK